MEIDKMLNKKELRNKFNEEVQKYNDANGRAQIQLGKLVILGKLVEEFKEPSEELKTFIIKETREAQKLHSRETEQLTKHYYNMVDLDARIMGR